MSNKNYTYYFYTGYANNKLFSDFEVLRNCIKDQLETCKDTTPANIMDATFKFIKKQMICNENSSKPVVRADAVTGGAFHSLGSSVLIFVTFVALFRL